MTATTESTTADLAGTSPWRRPEFRNLMAISITVALGFGMVIPVLPLYAKSFGVGLAVIGLIQFVFGLTRFSFGLVGGLVVDRFGERASTIAGLLIVAASSYAAGLAQSFPQLVVARGLGGAGSALFIGGLNNRILRIIEPEAMGRATGAFRASFLVGIGAGPALGGLVAGAFGLAAPFHFYATGLLLASESVRRFSCLTTVFSTRGCIAIWTSWCSTGWTRWPAAMFSPQGGCVNHQAP